MCQPALLPAVAALLHHTLIAHCPDDTLLPACCCRCRLLHDDDEGEQQSKALPPDSDVRLPGNRGKGPPRAVGAAAGAALAVPQQVGAKVAGGVAGSVWRMALGRVARALGAF